ncbi:hypothetical protein ACFX13_030637 [Malus domestica]
MASQFTVDNLLGTFRPRPDLLGKFTTLLSKMVAVRKDDILHLESETLDDFGDVTGTGSSHGTGQTVGDQ